VQGLIDAAMRRTNSFTLEDEARSEARVERFGWLRLEYISPELRGAGTKIAYIDPSSGGAASAGISTQKQGGYFVDKIIAVGSLSGKKHMNYATIDRR
jgi:hypothetical protein